jgi:hypothetical protein
MQAHLRGSFGNAVSGLHPQGKKNFEVRRVGGLKKVATVISILSVKDD